MFKHSIFRLPNKYIYSYLIIFFIPLFIFGVLNFIKLKNISNQQDEELYLQNLKVAKYSIESKIANIREFFNFVSNKKWVTNFCYSNEKYSSLIQNQVYRIYEARKDLTRLSLTVNDVEYIGLFFKDSLLVIDNINFYDAVNYFNSHCEIEGMHIGKWLSISESYNRFQLLPSMQATIGNRNVNSFLFIETIPFNRASAKGIIFAFINNQAFLDDINFLSIDNNAFGVIIDDKNRIVSASKNLNDDIPLSSYEDYSDINLIKTKSNKDLVHYSVKIDDLPWKIILIVNSKNYISYLLPSYYLIVIFFVFGLGVFISYYLSLKDNNKLKRFLNSLKIVNNTGDLTSILNNCINEIRTRTNMLKEQKLYLKSLYSDFKSLLYQSVFCNLLKLTDNTLTSNTTFLQSNLPNGYPTYVITLKIINRQNKIDNPEIVIAFKKLLDKKTYGNYMLHDLENDIVFIVQVPLEKDPHNNNVTCNIEALIIEINEFISMMENKADVQMHVGIGESSSSSDMLINSYRTSVANLVYNNRLNIKGTNPSKITYCKNHSEIFTIGLESQIIRHLIECNFKEINSIAKKLLDEKDKDCLSIYEIDLLYYEFASIIIRFLNSANDNPDTSNILLTFSKLKNTNSIEDIIKILDDICKYVKMKKEKAIDQNKSKDEELKYKLISFVNENVTNNNISLKLIKSKFNISFSLITKIIEDHSGYGYLEYVNRKRIECALKLLSSTNHSITKIREISGYNDDSTFIKVFKKYVGTTPGNYRKDKVLVKGW